MIIETMTACALMFGADSCEDKEKSGLMFSTAEDIRKEIPPPDHAPYIDEVTARFERKLNEKDERIEELEAKVKTLKKDVKSAKEEVVADADSEDDSNDIDDGNSSVDSSRDMALEDSEDQEEDEGGEKDSEDISEDTSEQESEPAEAQGQTFEATYYSAYCDTGCTGVTATGKDVSNSNYVDGKRVIAVDPGVIPLGTSVRVTTPNETFDAIAEDTGGDIQGNRIDILVDSTEEAYSLGRHDVQVEIIN